MYIKYDIRRHTYDARDVWYGALWDIARRFLTVATSLY